MPRPVSTKQLLVQLIQDRTKMRLSEIRDVLEVLPECLIEAFFSTNPAKKEKVPMGVVTMHWADSIWGPSIKLTQSVSFKQAIVEIKYAQKYPLAKKLWDMMHPNSQARTIKRKSVPLSQSRLEIRAEKRLMRQVVQKKAERSFRLKMALMAKAEANAAKQAAMPEKPLSKYMLRKQSLCHPIDPNKMDQT